MKHYNVIAVFDESASNVLMCVRSKPPYKGLLNFVGGKIEPGERGEDAAYRELCEETGITREDITLSHIMDYTYYSDDCSVEVYFGRMRAPKALTPEANALVWVDLCENFFDMSRFAGMGNIGHILAIIQSR